MEFIWCSDVDNNAVSDDDKVLFDVCQVLNSAVWPSLTKDESKDD